MKTNRCLHFLALGLLALLLSGGRHGAVLPVLAQSVGVPVIEWQNAGCYSSWCETGWYSSPAVADLDGDGTIEVLGGAYTLFALNGEDGSEQWHVPPPDLEGNARIWPGVVVADIDADGDLEVVTAHGYGYLRVVDHGGSEVWTRQPATSELRGLSAYDLDGDGTLEIVVTAAVGSRTNTWVYEHDGTVRAGWPQLSNDTGYAYGVFNDNAAVGDLDGDEMGEIVVPSDVHYVCAYERNGIQIPAHAMYGSKAWGAVGVHVDHAVDLRGWANCDNPPHPPLEPRPNFAHSPATIADVNADGVPEVVVVGNNYDCRTRPYTSLYEMSYVFNGDRSRWSGSGHDWTAIPSPDAYAAPLSEDWHEIESNQPNPVVADLDGDGEREILFPSYDGRLHAYWLDKTERHSWPFDVHTSGPLRFASEPVVADLDGDGDAEVVFTSWVAKGSGQTGKLHILSYLGAVEREVSLPLAYGSPDWNGALAAPTLANIDGDANLEVVINTAHSGFMAYELPGSANAQVVWGTGRGNYQRTGSYLVGSVDGSSKRVWPTMLNAGDAMTYTITLRNPGPDLETVCVTDTLPAEVQFSGSLSASAGNWGYAGGVITWAGALSAGTPVEITYVASVDALVTDPRAIPNVALIDDGLGNVVERGALAIANGYATFLPFVSR